MKFGKKINITIDSNLITQFWVGVIELNHTDIMFDLVQFLNVTELLYPQKCLLSFLKFN